MSHELSTVMSKACEINWIVLLLYDKSIVKIHRNVTFIESPHLDLEYYRVTAPLGVVLLTMFVLLVPSLNVSCGSTSTKMGPKITTLLYSHLAKTTAEFLQITFLIVPHNINKI